MSSITLSAAVRSNLLSLQNTASLLDTTQTRLATGNKVNSALDNPTNYFTASSLNARASDLGNLLDGVSNAIQTIQAANDGITSITKLVESAQATANQAQQLSATITTTVAAAAGTITSSSVVAPTANGTLTINGQNVSVVTGVTAAAGTVTGSSAATVTADGTLTINSRNYSLSAAHAAVAGTITGSAAANATATGTLTINGSNYAVTSGDDATAIAATINATATDVVASVGTGANAGKLIITGATGTDDVNITATVAGIGLATGNNAHTAAINADDATSIAALINADSGADFTASVGTGANAGKLIITGSTATTAVNVTATVAGTGLAVANHAATAGVIADDATTLAAKINAVSGIGVTATVGTGANAGKLIIAGTTATDDVNITATVAGLGLATGNNAHTLGSSGTAANPARAAYIAQYNGLLDQIDQLTADAGYNGNNLLSGASSQLKVLFNEAGSSSLTISGKDTTFAGLGLAKLTVGTEFDTNASITAILGTLKTATDTLRSDASSFGSNLSIVQTRQDFTKNLINTLQTGASNLTLADSNEEAANLLALQTRQSLSTKALSLASQSDQNVLRLLQ